MDGTRQLDGDDYEVRSSHLVESYGFRIIARQFRCKMGEIDLIASNDHHLLFIEVRARRHLSHGGAAASVDRKKQCRLIRCADYFIKKNPQWKSLPCRFDVIAWQPHPASGLMQARWIASAFIA